jgi:hypothetical protein
VVFGKVSEGSGEDAVDVDAAEEEEGVEVADS